MARKIYQESIFLSIANYWNMLWSLGIKSDQRSIALIIMSQSMKDRKPFQLKSQVLVPSRWGHCSNHLQVTTHDDWGHLLRVRLFLLSDDLNPSESLWYNTLNNQSRFLFSPGIFVYFWLSSHPLCPTQWRENSL